MNSINENNCATVYLTMTQPPKYLNMGARCVVNVTDLFKTIHYKQSYLDMPRTPLVVDMDYYGFCRCCEAFSATAEDIREECCDECGEWGEDCECDEEEFICGSSMDCPCSSCNKGCESEDDGSNEDPNYSGKICAERKANGTHNYDNGNIGCWCLDDEEEDEVEK